MGLVSWSHLRWCEQPWMLSQNAVLGVWVAPIVVQARNGTFTQTAMGYTPCLISIKYCKTFHIKSRQLKVIQTLRSAYIVLQCSIQTIWTPLSNAHALWPGSHFILWHRASTPQASDHTRCGVQHCRQYAWMAINKGIGFTNRSPGKEWHLHSDCKSLWLRERDAPYNEWKLRVTLCRIGLYLRVWSCRGRTNRMRLKHKTFVL
jgi:hypothetical protein